MINNKSFTLVELMVVIAITGIIAGLILASMRAGGQVTDLNSNAEKLAGIIRQTQMMALGGKLIDSVRPDYGYGVYITTDSYKLFVNDNNPSNYAYDVSDTVIQTFNFTENVTASPDDDYIIFIPPKSIIYVGDVGLTGDVLTGTSLITLQHVNNRSVYIRVNSQGEIDVY